MKNIIAVVLLVLVSLNSIFAQEIPTLTENYVTEFSHGEVKVNWDKTNYFKAEFSAEGIVTNMLAVFEGQNYKRYYAWPKTVESQQFKNLEEFTKFAITLRQWPGNKMVKKNLPYYPVGTFEYWYYDADNNGSDGGFTLLKVTEMQWGFLKERGLILHGLGNVMDTKYPKDFGPILMREGFMVFYKNSDRYDYLKETDPKPELFWVAVRTDEETYKQARR